MKVFFLIYGVVELFYCMLVGKLPFDDEYIKNIILYHNTKITNYEIPNFLLYNAQDILRRILVKNPKKRIKLNELKRHSFLLMSEKHLFIKELLLIMMKYKLIMIFY